MVEQYRVNTETLTNQFSVHSRSQRILINSVTNLAE